MNVRFYLAILFFLPSISAFAQVQRAAYIDRGDTQLRAAEFAAARKNYERVVEEEDSLTGLAYHKIGLTYYYEGKWQRASDAYRRAIAIRDRVLAPNSLDGARSRRNLGAALLQVKEYEEAGRVLREAVTTYASAPESDTLNWMRSLMNLTQLAIDRRDYQLAMSSAAGVADLLGGSDFSSRTEQQANYVAAQAYQSFNRPTSALPFAEAALEWAELDGYDDEVLKNLNLVSVVYAKLGRHEEQVEVAARALELAESVPNADTLDVGILHLNLARSYAKLDRLGEARLHADFALDLLRDHRPAWLPMVHSTRGDLAVLAEAPFDALAAFNAGLAAFHPMAETTFPRPHPDSLESDEAEEATILLGNRAALLTRSDQALEALADYELLFALQDRLRADLDLERSTSFLSNQLRGYYDQAVELLLSYAETSGDKSFLWDAFTLTERAKAYSLLRTMQQDRRRRGDREIALRARVAELQRLTVDDGKYQPALEAATLQLERLLHQRRKSSVATAAEPVGREVMELLREQNKVLLSYHLGKTNGYLFLADPEAGGLQVFPIGEVDRLGDRIEAFQSALEAGSYRRKTMRPAEEQRELDAAYVTHGYSLYRQLVADAQVPDRDLVVVPDGPLSILSFSGLPVAETESAVDYATLPYFLGDRTISYAYSAGILRELSDGRQDEEYELDLLAFAPQFSGQEAAAQRPAAKREGGRSLPGLTALRFNEAEVRDIAGVFPDHRLFFGAEANRENFLAEAGRARIVHLSTHGMVDATDPNLSFVAFSQLGDSLELEEMLYYNDLSAMDLRAELAVLSACETSLGEYHPGEHTFSLASAFTSAGARSTLTTLWQVDDEATQKVMATFYGLLAEGLPRDVALARAQRELLSGRTFRHPYYWSGFTLYGRTGTLVPAPARGRAWIWWLLSAGLVVALGGVLYRRWIVSGG